MAFETFEHTADLGLRVFAASLSDLYAESGLALFSVLVEDIETVQCQTKSHFRIDKDTAVSDQQWQAHLLVDWLGELLFVFETEHYLFAKFETRLTDTALEVDAWGEKIDPDRHELVLDIKAITYHGLAVREIEGQFQAEVIVDL